VAGGSTAPPGIDPTVPSTARMYDFWLGGKDHFAVDRAAALEVGAAAPEVKMMAVENRKFLRRVVRYLAAEAGIVQFLDIGTGLPTRATCTRSLRMLTRAPESCTWTTIRWCWPTLVHSRPAGTPR
jgi:S-adenosyl methyltransferase